MANNYNWDNFPIGTTRAHANCYRQAVINSFYRFIRARNLDWECSTKSDPATPKRGERCNLVWLTRIPPRQLIEEKDGMSIGAMPDELIDGPALKLRTGLDLKMPEIRAHMSFMKLRPLLIDIREVSMDERLKWFNDFEHKRRASQIGWERYAVNDHVILDTKMSTIRIQIYSAMLKWGKDWRWEVRRVQNPDDKHDRRPHYLVTRLR